MFCTVHRYGEVLEHEDDWWSHHISQALSSAVCCQQRYADLCTHIYSISHSSSLCRCPRKCTWLPSPSGICHWARCRFSVSATSKTLAANPWIRPVTWLLILHDVAVPISWSSQMSPRGLVLAEHVLNSGWFYINVCITAKPAASYLVHWLLVEEYNLLVWTGDMTLPWTIISKCRNVLEEGFSRPLFLPRSQLHDSVLCAEVADIDWDGQHELILGTYGKVCHLTEVVS